MQHVLFALLLPTYVLLPGAPPAQLRQPRCAALACRQTDDDASVASYDDIRLEQVRVLADTATGVEGEDEDGGGAKTFEALGVESRMVSNLAASSITAPNALQRSAYEPIASGRDCILHAWTGSGKTLSFLLPLLSQLDATSREPQALVLSPSRELAFQIQRVAESVLEGTGLSSAAVVGGANPNRQLERIKKTRPQLIVGTPGRVGELAFEWKKLKLQRVRHIVIDEVDEALRVPHLDHTLKLLESAQDGRPLQLVFASATADTPAVRRVAAQLLTNSPLLLRPGRRSPPTPTPPMRTARARPPRRRVSARSCRWASSTACASSAPIAS